MPTITEQRQSQVHSESERLENCHWVAWQVQQGLGIHVVQAEKPEDIVEGGPPSESEDEADVSQNGSQSKEGAQERGCGEEKEYEFTCWEERVLQVQHQLCSWASAVDSALHLWIRVCDTF